MLWASSRRERDERDDPDLAGRSSFSPPRPRAAAGRVFFASSFERFERFERLLERVGSNRLAWRLSVAAERVLGIFSRAPREGAARAR